MDSKREGVGGGMDWEFRISNCKLLYRVDVQQSPNVKQKTIFSILRKTIMEKNIFKNVCICVTESLSCTAEINTTLCINYTSVKRMLKLKKKHYLI